MCQTAEMIEKKKNIEVESMEPLWEYMYDGSFLQWFIWKTSLA